MKPATFRIFSIVCLFFAALTFISCQNSTKNPNTSALDDQLDMEAIDQAEDDFTEESMAWTGIYEGTLPCADCEGIETTIVLNDDNTYHKTETYLKGDSPDEFVEEGIYELDESQGLLALSPSESENEVDTERSQLYQWEDDQLIALNQDGTKVEGEMADLYVLEKL